MAINWVMVAIILGFVLAWFVGWAITKIVKGFSREIKIIGRVLFWSSYGILLIYAIWSIFL